MYGWATEQQPEIRTGWFFEEWRQDTLAGFVWRLQLVAHASIKVQEDVLPRYLHPKGGTTGVRSVTRVPQ
jgi:hypothetical protein